MKIIRNGICYIEQTDIIFLQEIPRNILSERSCNYSFGIPFDKYTTEKAVSFFQNTECILDYDSISNLSMEELDEEINKTYTEMNELSRKILDSSYCINNKYLKTIERDTNIDKMMEFLKHRLTSLISYKDNRELYDKAVNNLSFSKGINRVPLKYVSAVSHTEPVERIVISSSRMEELNRCIRAKCKQNEREQIASKLAAREYFVGIGISSANSGQTLNRTLK